MKNLFKNLQLKNSVRNSVFELEFEEDEEEKFCLFLQWLIGYKFRAASQLFGNNYKNDLKTSE